MWQGKRKSTDLPTEEYKEVEAKKQGNFTDKHSTVFGLVWFGLFVQ